MNKDDEFYDDMGDYMMRVSGLGSVEALFFRHAKNSVEARAGSELSARLDRRRTIIGLYKITKLYTSKEAGLPQQIGLATYLLTGIEKTDKKKHSLDIFFEAESIEDAKRYAEKHNLQGSKLYYCEPL